jgi:hypothetical protein
MIGRHLHSPIKLLGISPGPTRQCNNKFTDMTRIHRPALNFASRAVPNGDIHVTSATPTIPNMVSLSRQPSTVASDVIDLSSDTEGQPLPSSQAYCATVDLVDTDDEVEPLIDFERHTVTYDRIDAGMRNFEPGLRDPLRRQSSSLLTQLDSFSQSLASGGGGGSDENAIHTSNKRKSMSSDEGKGSPPKKTKTVRKPRVSQVRYCHVPSACVI